MKNPWISKESLDLINQGEDVNKKILSTSSERVKRELRPEYVRKDRKVKRRIKADKTKWIDNITKGREGRKKPAREDAH